MLPTEYSYNAYASKVKIQVYHFVFFFVLDYVIHILIYQIESHKANTDSATDQLITTCFGHGLSLKRYPPNLNMIPSSRRII